VRTPFKDKHAELKELQRISGEEGELAQRKKEIADQKKVTCQLKLIPVSRTVIKVGENRLKDKHAELKRISGGVGKGNCQLKSTGYTGTS
jgi:hypothetical protein